MTQDRRRHNKSRRERSKEGDAGMSRHRRRFHRSREKGSKAGLTGLVMTAMAVIAAVIAFFSSNYGIEILPGGGSGFLHQRINEVIESTESEEDIRIVIETTNVYVGEEKLAFKKENTEDLKKVLKKKLEDLFKDNTVVYFDYENGDYNTYKAVKEVLDDLTITPIEVKDS